MLGPVVQCNVGNEAGWWDWRLSNVGGFALADHARLSDKFMPFMNQPPGRSVFGCVQTYGRPFTHYDGSRNRRSQETSWAESVKRADTLDCLRLIMVSFFVWIIERGAKIIIRMIIILRSPIQRSVLAGRGNSERLAGVFGTSTRGADAFHTRGTEDRDLPTRRNSHLEARYRRPGEQIPRSLSWLYLIAVSASLCKSAD